MFPPFYMVILVRFAHWKDPFQPDALPEKTDLLIVTQNHIAFMVRSGAGKDGA